MKAAIIFGLSASGKSTKAQEYVQRGFVEINRDNIRFSEIDPGGDWTTYKFNKKNEKRVTEIWWQHLRDAAFSEKDIVISDTLLNRGKRDNVVDELISLGYDDISVHFLEAPLEELIERDEGRGNKSVGKKVIENQWKQLYGEGSI